ncbi:ubiquitin E3 ligase ICP0 [Felid alphaherpesvirus 1]|nr:ubiquitin E3 ligase ICP0 [Felid alphaherpesvirus 1]ALJ84539.1 ubiquitin E3 ligase ICP0 [Felid alphaherpesvirus 1]
MADMGDHCPICLDPMNDLTFTMPCLHKFCYSCLSRWVGLNNKCPLCKTSVTSLIHSIEDDKIFEETKLYSPHREEEEYLDWDPFIWTEARRWANISLNSVRLENSTTVDTSGRPSDGAGNPTSTRPRDSTSTGLGFVPLTPDGGAGAPHLRPLVTWMNSWLLNYYNDETTASVMCGIVMDELCEHAFNSAALTRLLRPLLHTQTDLFVIRLLAEASQCVFPSTARTLRVSTGVQFLDDTEDDTSSDDESSSLATADLTDPEDTAYDDTDDSDDTETTISTDLSVGITTGIDDETRHSLNTQPELSTLPHGSSATNFAAPAESIQQNYPETNMEPLDLTLAHDTESSNENSTTVIALDGANNDRTNTTENTAVSYDDGRADPIVNTTVSSRYQKNEDDIRGVHDADGPPNTDFGSHNTPISVTPTDRKRKRPPSRWNERRSARLRGSPETFNLVSTPSTSNMTQRDSSTTAISHTRLQTTRRGRRRVSGPIVHIPNTRL